MRITSKGQVTIPQDIRKQAGFLPNTEVEFEFREGVVIMRKTQGTSERSRAITSKMKGAATVRLSTDEIMGLTRGEGE